MHEFSAPSQFFVAKFCLKRKVDESQNLQTIESFHLWIGCIGAYNCEGHIPRPRSTKQPRWIWNSIYPGAETAVKGYYFSRTFQYPLCTSWGSPHLNPSCQWWGLCYCPTFTYVPDSLTLASRRNSMHIYCTLININRTNRIVLHFNRNNH